jgi:hypothetical protein
MSEQVSFACAADTREQKPQLRELAPHVYGYISDFDPTAASSSATGEASRPVTRCAAASRVRGSRASAAARQRGYQPSTRCSGR